MKFVLHGHVQVLGLLCCFVFFSLGLFTVVLVSNIAEDVVDLVLPAHLFHSAGTEFRLGWSTNRLEHHHFLLDLDHVADFGRVQSDVLVELVGDFIVQTFDSDVESGVFGGADGIFDVEGCG